MRRRITERFAILILPAAGAALLALGLGSHADAAGAPGKEGCGPKQIRKSDGGYWQCTFADNFGGTSVDPSKWIAQRTDASGFGDGTSCFVDSPDNVSVSDGNLQLTSRKE